MTSARPLDLALGGGRGQWTGIPGEGGARGAMVTCPGGCGRKMVLGPPSHFIDALGFVTPEVVCPDDERCRFADSVRLVGWRWE